MCSEGTFCQWWEDLELIARIPTLAEIKHTERRIPCVLEASACVPGPLTSRRTRAPEHVEDACMFTSLRRDGSERRKARGDARGFATAVTFPIPGQKKSEGSGAIDPPSPHMPASTDVIMILGFRTVQNQAPSKSFAHAPQKSLNQWVGCGDLRAQRIFF